MKIGLINTAAANIFSVSKAIERIGCSPIVIDSPAELKRVRKLILPGVGHFKTGMKKLSSDDWFEAIAAFTSHESNYVLGICLGMQMLFEGSDESPQTQGLSLVRGRFQSMAKQTPLKVPHVGWTGIDDTNRTNELLRGVNNSDRFYFLHSYYLPANSDTSIARSVYGDITFSSAIYNGGNIFGTQFHPEKSRASGEKILKNFQTL